MNLKKIKAWLLAGIAMTLLWFVIGFIVQGVLPYDPMELPGIRPLTDPLWIGFFAYPLLLSAVMVFGFERFESKLKGHKYQKAFEFGVVVWAFSGLLTTFIVLTSMVYPLGFHIEGFVGSFVYTLAGAYVIVHQLEK